MVNTILKTFVIWISMELTKFRLQNPEILISSINTLLIYLKLITLFSKALFSKGMFNNKKLLIRICLNLKSSFKIKIENLE